jgi:hypothetical protein
VTTDDCANFGHVTGLGIHPHNGGGLATQADRLILFNIGRQPFVLSILRNNQWFRNAINGIELQKKKIITTSLATSLAAGEERSTGTK